MNAVVYYSNTGQSHAVAAYLAAQLGFPLIELQHCRETALSHLVLVFPVHAQSIPAPVRAFLERVRTDALAVLATYGKMCHGNVLQEIQRKYRHRIVAAAYVPTKHAYLPNDGTFDRFDALLPLIEKLRAPAQAPVRLPKCAKNPLAVLFPKTRARLGVRILRHSDCDRCGTCVRECPEGAMAYGIPNARCIRCLRCVSVCPRQALTFRLCLPLRQYLKRKPKNGTVLYL